MIARTFLFLMVGLLLVAQARSEEAVRATTVFVGAGAGFGGISGDAAKLGHVGVGAGFDLEVKLFSQISVGAAAAWYGLFALIATEKMSWYLGTITWRPYDLAESSAVPRIGIGLGVASYESVDLFAGRSSGSGFAAVLRPGVDFRLSPHWAVGVSTSIGITQSKLSGEMLLAIHAYL